MIEASDFDGDAAEVITSCRADLAANRSAESVLSRLRAIEPRVPATPTERARFLTARAIAVNRLGLPSEALGDLYEARRLVEGEAHHAQTAEIDRAIALVHAWRADGREAAFALLRSTAAAALSHDSAALALTLIDAGRLELEIGRPVDAERFLAAGLQIGGDRLPAVDKARASVNLVQTLVAAERFDRASALLAAIEGLLVAAPPRLRLLAELESARIAVASGDLSTAREALLRSEDWAPDHEEAYERTEIAHLSAELALAEGDPARAEELIRSVAHRYATDDLTGREIAARRLQADVLEACDRGEEATRTLVAALRRAVTRGLHGHADLVRARLAARGGRDGPMPPAMVGVAVETDASRRFARRRPLGAGSGGSVSRRYDVELGIEVALKRVRLDDVYDTAVRARRFDEVAAEAAAAAGLDHPGVAGIHGLLREPNGDLLLVEELIDGPTLRAAMATRMAQTDALLLLSRIASALAAIHSAGIVHRDIKPDNIVLRGGVSPVIVDFGIARIARSRRQTTRMGTKGYRAPEQERRRDVTPRADLYALGVVAHELLLGALPEEPGGALAAIAEPWRRRRRGRRLESAGLDPAIADLVARLLAPQAAWRPRSAAFVATRFAAAASRSPDSG